MFDVMGMPMYFGMQAVAALPKAAITTYEGLSRMSRSMNYTNRNAPFANAQFNDSQQAYTMRQAGMQLAKASKYNMQQTMLGNEAQFYTIKKR